MPAKIDKPRDMAKEIARLTAEVESSGLVLAEMNQKNIELLAVVNAAREVVEIRSCTNRLRKALRTLDGEVKP